MSLFVRCGAEPGSELGGKGWHLFAIEHPPAGKRGSVLLPLALAVDPESKSPAMRGLVVTQCKFPGVCPG